MHVGLYSDMKNTPANSQRWLSIGPRCGDAFLNFVVVRTSLRLSRTNQTASLSALHV